MYSTHETETTHLRQASLEIQVGIVVLLLTGWLSVAGWIYADQYFAWFSIPLANLGVPYEFMVHYGVDVAWRNGLWMLFGGLALGLFFVRHEALSAWIDRQLTVTLGRQLTVALGVALVMSAFFGAGVLARWTAERDHLALARANYNQFPRVLLDLKDGAPMTGRPDFVEELSTQGCWRLVFSGAHNLWLLRTLQGEDGHPPAAEPRIASISRGEVRSTQISAKPGNCLQEEETE